MDNLNTHNGALLYEAFEATEARHLWERLQVHYTPKHGSWLNHGRDRALGAPARVYAPQDAGHRDAFTRGYGLDPMNVV